MSELLRTAADLHNQLRQHDQKRDTLCARRDNAIRDALAEHTWQEVQNATGMTSAHIRQIIQRINMRTRTTPKPQTQTDR